MLRDKFGEIARHGSTTGGTMVFFDAGACGIVNRFGGVMRHFKTINHIFIVCFCYMVHLTGATYIHPKVIRDQYLHFSNQDPLLSGNTKPTGNSKSAPDCCFLR